jgi:predicted  nucleic acid-binding Zn-ribbon protein
LNSDISLIFKNYGRLLDRINDLILAVENIAEENKTLKSELEKMDGKLAAVKESSETFTMKEELKKLKNENKRLKEKETLIKTKIERLAVKLEQIHL